MFVMTIDQRASRRDGDHVPELLAALADIPARLGFERSVGDEVQGILTDPSAVVEVAMRALRTGRWYVGIGIGTVATPLPASPREASGTALVQGRLAVDRAKKTGERAPLAVVFDADSGFAGAGAASAADAAEAVLVLIGDLVRKRSSAEWRVLDALNSPDMAKQVDVAQALGISPQAVSKAIFRSGLQEEQGGRSAAALLLSLANEGSRAG